jgi:tetratricopeptide (TPR) repeat protein
MTSIFACLCALSLALASFTQVTSDSIHEIEVRIKAGGGQVSGVRVRLLRQSGMMLVSESFSSQEGQVRFSKLMPGEYIVETVENERFEATTTRVSVFPIEFRKPRPLLVTVTVDIPGRKRPQTAAPGVVSADTDLEVPEAALKHYRKGVEALSSGKTSDAVKGFKAAVEAHPRFYAARLELGRGLRAQKRFNEAEEALRPLLEIAPGRAEPRIELAIVLLVLRRPKDSARELRKALELEEASWVSHLYLGWALLEEDPDQAARHFTRALDLDERKAAQAHLSLARLSHGKGMKEDAIRHLESYLALAPDAPDASAVRKLLGQIRK